MVNLTLMVMLWVCFHILSSVAMILTLRVDLKPHVLCHKSWQRNFSKIPNSALQSPYQFRVENFSAVEISISAARSKRNTLLKNIQQSSPGQASAVYQSDLQCIEKSEWRKATSWKYKQWRLVQHSGEKYWCTKIERRANCSAWQCSWRAMILSSDTFAIGRCTNNAGAPHLLTFP